MLRFFTFLFLSLMRAQPASSEPIFEQFTIELPDDLQFIDCDYCPDGNVLLNWTPDTDTEELEAFHEYVELTGNDEEIADLLGTGIAGQIELFYMPFEERHRALQPLEIHVLQCWQFKEHWGFGFSTFDQAKNTGHCATPIGALIYMVCRYFDEGAICGAGNDLLEMSHIENDNHAASQRLKDAWDAYGSLPTPDSEKKILSALRAAGNVSKIEEILENITLREEN